MLKKVLILSTTVAFIATVPAFAASVASTPVVAPASHATFVAKKSADAADILKVKKKKKKKEAAPSAT